MNTSSMITIATLLGPVVIIFVICGFATDHWVEIDVNRNRLSDTEKKFTIGNQDLGVIYHTRHRGIFRECFTGEDATFLDDAVGVVESNCIYIQFEVTDEDEMSSEYQQRMHILRSLLAFYVIGMVMTVVAFFLALALCCTKTSFMANSCCLVNLLAAFFLLCAMVLFHAKEYVEANEEGRTGEVIFQNTWSEDLNKATDYDLGYSYALAWVGFILAGIVGFIYLLIGRRLQQNSKDDGSDTSSSDDSQENAKTKRQSVDRGVYDNYGMSYDSGAYPVPVYMEGVVPAMHQNMAGYPAITYDPFTYKMTTSGDPYRSDT